MDYKNCTLQGLTYDTAIEISQWEYDKPYDVYNFKGNPNGYLLNKDTWGKEQFCLLSKGNVIGQVVCQFDGNNLWVGWSLSPLYCGKGNGYGIEDIRPEENDLRLIPNELFSISREGADLLGQPEYRVLEELMGCDTPPNMSVSLPCLSINADYDVYPNIAEPAEWWRLGNLKTDGIHRILRNYHDERTLGMRMNRDIPVSELAKTYGDLSSKKLYDKSDLITCLFGRSHNALV